MTKDDARAAVVRAGLPASYEPSFHAALDAFEEAVVRDVIDRLNANRARYEAGEVKDA